MLELTPAYVKGVVTFYTMYHQHPVGKHFIQVCTTSPCNVCGAEDVVNAFLKHTGCGELGVTSADGKFTVIEVECLGACGFATPVMVNERVHRVGDAGDGARDILASSTELTWDTRTSRTRARRWSCRKYFGEPEAIGLDGWRKRGGYVALREGARR